MTFNKIGAGLNGVNSYNGHDDHYDDLVSSLRGRFSKLIEGRKLFTTDSTGLYKAYLQGFPEHQRQYYTCHECERFINTVGGLVTIDDKGRMTPVLWEGIEVPAQFTASVERMKNIVKRAKVSGVFIPDSKRVGVAKTGIWTHFCVDVPTALVHKSKIKTAFQVAAEKKEEFGMLVRALYDFSTPTVDQAIGLLRSESLFRGEKDLPKAEWFRKVQASYYTAKGGPKLRENVLWLAVANAPTGFAHIRSGMLGTLLEDLKAGLSVATIKKNYAAKKDPLQYMRAQTAPKAGNLARANKIVELLKAEGAFSRRFARLDELKLEWQPRVRKSVAPTEGLFSHLSPKQKEDYSNKHKLHAPGVTNITFEKFARTVLPYAEEIEYQVPSVRQNFSAILTADNLSAPPIIQWDKEGQRNPFNWYVYNGGSTPSDFNISAGYRKVTGITLQPSMWYEENKHQGKAAFFILDGCKDTRYRNSGIALFPEILKSEYHEIRSSIEALSKSEKLKGYDRASACGIRLQANMTSNVIVRVTTITAVEVYKIDRWD